MCIRSETGLWYNTAVNIFAFMVFMKTEEVYWKNQFYSGKIDVYGYNEPA